METLGTALVSIMAGLALAAAAGLRAFVPLLVLSIAARLGAVDLHDNMAFLASDVALWSLLLAALIELTGDKIPLVDHLLDTVATFVRPAAGFLAGIAVLADLPDPVAIALALFFAMVSLGTHFEHARTRAGSTVLTAGFGNPVLSFLEDLVSGILSVLAVFAPILAAILAFGVVYLMWRLYRRLRRRGGDARESPPDREDPS
jgi:hypothetical protein